VTAFLRPPFPCPISDKGISLYSWRLIVANQSPLLGLKRILSFRSSKILVDASDEMPPAHETTQSSWERVELPSESLVELDATQRVMEVDRTGTLDWALELDGGLNTWGPFEMAAWQSAAMLDSDLAEIQEMPASQPQPQPQELASDSYGSSTACSTSADSSEENQESFEFTSLSPRQTIYAATNIHNSAVSNHVIIENPSQRLSTQKDSPKPFLRLVTGNLVAKAHTSLEDQESAYLYNNAAVYCPNDKFLAFPELQQRGTVFPSPPTSPIPRYEHDGPVSPMETSPHSFPTSRYSTFSSLSSLLMNDTIISSFSDTDISEDTNPSARMFDDREMCVEPDSLDDYDIPTSDVLSDLDSTGIPTDYLPELEAENDLTILLQGPDSAAHSADACLNTMSAKFEVIMTDYFAQLPDCSNFEASPSASGPPSGHFKEQWVTADTFGIGPDHRSYQSSADSTSSSPGGESQQPSTTPSIKSSSPKEDLSLSPRLDDHRSLSRSPAFRAVYKCTYGSCTFEPTGKRVYHKRTLQRHQEKCFHSPLPREKKPCKCTFPGCNKGFSRSDGLNAHRRTSGHGVKIELQFMEGNNHLREAVELP
jgi:hypothetical protein